MSIIKYYNLVDNEVFIFDDFIINQIKEGVAIESRHNDIINNIVLKYFSGRNMVYISNRMKSYSVNPLNLFGNRENSKFSSHSIDPKNCSNEEKRSV